MVQPQPHAQQTPAKGAEEGNPRNRNGSNREGRGNPEERYARWDIVLTDLQNRYPTYNTITLQNGSAMVSTAKFGNTRSGDRFTFNPRTAEITEIQLYKDLPKSGKIRGWIYSVHVGHWGGLITRILFCLVSFLGAVFALPGYYLCIRRLIRNQK